MSGKRNMIFSSRATIRDLSAVCRRRIPVFGIVAVGAASLVLAAVGNRPAVAGPSLERSFEVQNYLPAPGPGQYLTVESTRMPAHLGWGLALDYTFQYRPLAIYSVEGDRLRHENVVVEYQNTFYLSGFLGIVTGGVAGGWLFKEIQFALMLPMTQQSGVLDLSSYPLPSSTTGEVRPFALGDVRLHVKTSLWRSLKGRLRFALSTMVSLPWSGDIPNYQAHNNFAGEKNVTIWPRAIVELDFGRFGAAVNAGFLARVEDSTFLSTRMGHQFTYGAAGMYRFLDRGAVSLGAIVEVSGRNGLSDELDQNPLEVNAGVRVVLNWGFSVTAGGGAGLIKAVGSPLARAFMGLAWTPQWMIDSDRDGVPDYRDRCPDRKEDRDGFRDRDGCPDPDNDGDGIPDTRDKCPRQPEDMDGHEDNDGCPEPDNDGDRVCDDNPTIQKDLGRFAKICTGRDHCPAHPGPADSKGCPPDMLDTDGDRIPDGRDRCPTRAEDMDGHQDKDGCPDPDNDRDGICDPNDEIQDNLKAYSRVCKGSDRCPNDPEDRDGFQDEDGCPDPDNDGDHICDDNPVIQKKLSKYADRCVGADKCPNRPETINGVQDTDGCPDKGDPDVLIQGNRVALRRNLQFKGTSARMIGPSQAILMQIVWHLKFKLSTFKKLVVVGFVEPRMRRSKAKKVSQVWADAVRAFLVRYGIPKGKIMAKGLGGARPVYTGSSRRKRKRLNRRVEFYLVR